MKELENFRKFLTEEELSNNEKISDLIKAIRDIRVWVEDERNPKKFAGLLDNIDYAMGIAKSLEIN